MYSPTQMMCCHMPWAKMLSCGGRGGRGRGRQSVPAPGHHDLALVLENHLVVLVDTHSAYSHDARLVGAPVLALQHPGKGAQGVPRIDRSNKLHLVVTEVGNGLLRIVLYPE